MDKSLVKRIEEAALQAWPSIKQMAYDGWVIRVTEGPSKRVNSVNVYGPSHLPLAEKVCYCEALYQREGLPLIFRLPEPLTPTALLAGLAALGYQSFDPTLVLGRKILEEQTSCNVLGVKQMAALDWLAVRAWMMGIPLTALGYHAAILKLILPEKALFCLFDAGLPVACGMGVVQGKLLGYFSIYTHRGYRRRGHARAMMTALTRWGRERGAAFGYLQVEGDNEPAKVMYENLGFARLYGYAYTKK
jgi:N-acetylglutamate synthase